MGDRKTEIRVACAVLVRGRQVLAALRGTGLHAGKWEFPGGKIEEGETPENALVRELHEELGVRLTVEHPLTTVRHRYGSGQEVVLYPFLIDPGDFSPVPVVHAAIRWVELKDLNNLDWLEADYPILEEVRRVLA
ncbi:(deoxy)nucleoside triphosphate pyrophosphohydrolase [Leptospirillum ferriphilum]|uniref:8-oxo-dGTP diphosphatase n=2 Tax=Leptospirillum TaxID=179 RepID=A0A094WGL6_9BACT|nr:(deoxy)nucleoside triphosphate pyrophosphohydrolase [Leptospirillum ferriphilum]EDZ39806.1 MAG: Putative NUDIX hydrolase [Leptospirillum sp. Group II '5-way CG']KGA94802.1 Mutator mutT protein [Leptospirillum ferriphilum]